MNDKSPKETEVPAAAPTEKREWVTPATTTVQVSEVTQAGVGLGNTDLGMCHS